MSQAVTAPAAQRRAELLDKVVDQVLERGISQLTLRSLATAVGSNNRMLLYYFGSREELIVAAVHGAERRFPGMERILVDLDDRTRPLADRVLGAWAVIADPANLPFHRLFFEIFGLAGFERDRFRTLLGLIGNEWVGHLAAGYRDEGTGDARAESLAHETVALWRGFQATLLSLDSTDAVGREAVARASRDALEALLARAGRLGSDASVSDRHPSC